MTRSPLFYPLNRGMDAEAGGLADLQTDVMRFIAILALCLVAIFSLVQSIPLAPIINQPPPAGTEAPQPDVSQTAAPEPAARQPGKAEPVIIEHAPPASAKEEKSLVITRPAPQRIPVKRAPTEIVNASTAARPAEAERASEKPVERAAPTPTPPATPKGFTLRFETDLALTRLVARNEVGLYAITPEKSLRMNVNRGDLSFWAASLPNEFHEMDEATVPEEVLGALRRAGSVKTSDVKWGVTLPPDMRQQLNRYLSEYNEGALIIGGDGTLRREP